MRLQRVPLPARPASPFQEQSEKLWSCLPSSKEYHRCKGDCAIPWGYWVPLALLGGNRPEFLPFGVISYHSVYVTWEQQGEKGGFRIKTKDASIRHMGLYLWTIWVLSGDFYGALVKLLPRAIKYIAGKGQAPTACHNHQPSRSSWVTDISSANRLVNPA